MADPWDVRAAAPRGDVDTKPLFLAIGACLTEWAQVEHAWARIYSVLVSVPKKSFLDSPAVRAFGAMQGFNAQCSLLRPAAATFFHYKKNFQRHEPDFTGLMNLSGKFVLRRNEIAHGQVSELTYSPYKNGRRARSLGYYLLPLLYNPKKNRLTEGLLYRYTSGDLIHYRQEFTKLSLKVGGLYERMLERRRA